MDNLAQLDATVFDVLPESVIVTDSKLNIIKVNQAFSVVTGYSKEEVIGKAPSILQSGKHDKFFYKKLWNNINKYNFWKGEIWNKRKNGELYPEMLSIKKVTNIDSQVTFYIGVFSDITQLKASTMALKESESKFRQLVENIKGHYFFYTYNLDKQFTYISDSMTDLLGYSQDEFSNHYKHNLLDNPNINTVPFNIDLCLERIQPSHSQELKINHKDGSIRYLEMNETPLLNHNNKVIGIEGIARDITDKYQAEQEVKEQQKFLQSIIDGIYDPVMVINENYEIKLMNKPIRNLIDLDCIEDELHPKCYEVYHSRTTPCEGKDYSCPLKRVFSTQENIKVIHKYPISKNGKKYMELSCSPLLDSEKNTIGIIESIRDITSHLLIQDELREQKDILSFQANHDALTLLPNRLLLMDRLCQMLKSAQRKGTKVAVLFIDLDNFKQINDSLGHNVGDNILITTAKRLKLCIRESDTVARLGGDEFTILIDNIVDTDVVSDIATKVITSLEELFIENEHALRVTSSIGISLYPDDSDSVNEMLRNADAAMYKAKEAGRNTYQYYTEDMTLRAYEHIQLESNLRKALANNELYVYYQPQFNGQNDQIVGMEALVRWQHPEQGLISPAKFIPIAEKTGLIIPLGEYIFNIATKQISDWKNIHKFTGRMAINLSVKQFQQDNIVDSLLKILNKNDCQAQWIELEITENYVMDDPEQAITTLNQFQAMGIQIAIDDFGTGYSSLSYLKRFLLQRFHSFCNYIQSHILC